MNFDIKKKSLEISCTLKYTLNIKNVYL